MWIKIKNAKKNETATIITVPVAEGIISAAFEPFVFRLNPLPIFLKITIADNIATATHPR